MLKVIETLRVVVLICLRDLCEILKMIETRFVFVCICFQGLGTILKITESLCLCFYLLSVSGHTIENIRTTLFIFAYKTWAQY